MQTASLVDKKIKIKIKEKNKETQENLQKISIGYLS